MGYLPQRQLLKVQHTAQQLEKATLKVVGNNLSVGFSSSHPASFRSWQTLLDKDYEIVVFRSILLSQLCHCCFWFSVITISDRHDKPKTCENVLAALLQKWLFVLFLQEWEAISQFVLTYLLLPWQGTVKDKRTILYCCRATWHLSLALISLERELLTHCYFSRVVLAHEK